MPHTRRKKPSASQNKRLQLTDDSGWTHVTTNKHARRVRQSTPNPNTSVNGNGQDNDVEREEIPEQLVPAEAPPRTTFSDLQRQLELYRQRWENSATWGCVVEGLKCGVSSLTAQRKDEDEDEAEDGISIVCIGLGSPSGFLRGGWVDRRSVSMYQLAALASVLSWIENYTSSLTSKPRITAYAQDPVFNTYDESLLNSLNITVLAHPHAFQKVTKRTLLFCPGAERRHLEALLARDPAIVFGGPLDDIESDVVKSFVQNRESIRLKEFSELEAAFWGMSVYFPAPEVEEDGLESKESEADPKG
ncbi:SRR1 family protein [Aspergillus mulundensis]|uniref:SRR1-like domain-containing protein n=1 Tax=Aspergillus mulundensis TaxID=1810919 RepID=A0A3D8REL9_9EURO|nr:Uncharacterized protein DSM5745_07654 [Aspergillus mulundensis]RDW72482.1 Uncharacterized protein DSM5745_07654 [Aspergillus mulundensis]